MRLKILEKPSSICIFFCAPPNELLIERRLFALKNAEMIMTDTMRSNKHPSSMPYDSDRSRNIEKIYNIVTVLHAGT